MLERRVWAGAAGAVFHDTGHPYWPLPIIEFSTVCCCTDSREQSPVQHFGYTDAQRMCT